MYLSEGDQKSGRNRYEGYYVYKIRYFYTFMCLCWFRIIAVFFLPDTAKKTVSKKGVNTASEKTLSFLLSHIITLYTK
jgi:hypothetical protein